MTATLKKISGLQRLFSGVLAVVLLIVPASFLVVLTGLIDYLYIPTETPITFPVEELFTTNEGVQEYIIDFLTFHEAEALIPIIACESEFKHFDDDGSVLRNRAGSNAIGVAQIMSSVHPDPQVLKRYNRRNRTNFSEEHFDLTTLTGNIRYALVLYEIRGTRDWECAW